MLEGNLFGMEMQSACLLVAVERIAQDGGIQAFLMGTMHAQLVGSARLGIERQAEMGGVDALQNLIFRNGLLALLVIHNLAGTVQVIGHQTEGEIFCFPAAIVMISEILSQASWSLHPNDGDVFLLNPMVQKLLLQTMIGKLGLGNNHQSAGCHVQTMDDERTCCLWIFPPHDANRPMAGHASFPGTESNPRRLVDNGQLVIFVEAFPPAMTFFGMFRYQMTLSRQHPMQYRLALAIAGRIELQMMANFLFRTFSPPEHRHLQRLVTMLVSILQQLRFAALATSGWRHHLQGCYSARSNGRLRIIPEGCISENLQQILAFSFMIQHAELREQPLLQGIR